MNASRWQRVQELFEGALARPAAERASWLDSQCGKDEELRTEVDGLLQADAEAGQSIVEAVKGGQELLLGERPTGDTVAGPLGPPAGLPKANPDSGDVDSAAITALSPGGGGRVVSPPVDAEGRTRFGRYTVDAWIGQGGFGVVYRGHDPVLKRRVAIKTCTGLDADLRRRFFREGQIAAGLQHPNIVTVHELGVESGVPYMVQEFLDGDDLRQLVPRHAELPLEQRLRILYEVARGLDHAHRAGVLHRDVKPANIRILADGSVKILDFGIAKLLDAESQLTGTGTTLGTVGYLAPEQLRSEPIDARADIFSFGVVAYELLTGQRPFRGQDFSQVSYQLLFVEPDPVSLSWPGCPRALVELVSECLAKEREGRPEDFGVIVRRLEGLLDQERSGGTLAVADPVLPAPPPEGEPATGGSAANPVSAPVATAASEAGGRGRWWVAVGGMAAVLVAGIWWQGSQDAGTPTPEPVQVAMGATGLESGAAPALSGTGGGGALPSLGGDSSDATNPGTTGVEDGPREDSPPLELGVEGEADPPDPGALASDGATDVPQPGELAENATPANTPPEGGDANGSPADSGSPVEQSPGEITDSSADPSVDPEVAAVASGSLTTSEPLGRNSDTEPTGAASRSETVIGGGQSAVEVDGEPSDASPGPTTVTGPGGGSRDGSETEVAAAVRTEPATNPTSGAPPIERGAFLVEGDGVIPPTLLRRDEPVYPRRARRRGIEERVMVKVLVDEEGKVLQAIVPQDEHGFGEAARQAALRSLFSPATQNGVAGKMWINLPFEFKLRN